ncbi:MAG: 4Fe-4S dicluster domain-containing protein [Mobilicoccus sp.]|nr:4Fe-4S dicluster domain-containing protein [Mobilicoccus sp.]
MGFWRNQLSGPTDPARDAGWENPPKRTGFFTDTSICIGCKACEVACKEWNGIPMDRLGMTGDSYDNTISLGASTWRHVAFVEQGSDRVARARAAGSQLVDLGMPTMRTADPLPRATQPRVEDAAPTGLPLDGPGTAMSAVSANANPLTDPEAARRAAADALAAGTVPDFRWLIASDVCKHCTHAACLDVCPTGSLFRTEFGTVVVQDDICNGCGYCVAACPFGVIERRERPDGQTGAVKNEGIAQKCTLCYDRIGADQTPACAQACPTTSIQYGDLDDMRARAQSRVEALHEQGYTEARLYGASENDGVGGTGSVFLLLDEPEVYGLPPDPVVTTADLPDIFSKAGWAGVAMLGLAAVSFLGRRS